MITKELIERINYLAKKKKNQGLSEEELQEQQRLRRTYLDAIKKQVVDVLEAEKPAPDNSCSCGCGGNHAHHH